MEKNLNTTVFAIVKGVDDSRGIVSVWTSKEEAERNVELLNAGMRYWDYEVEEVALNGFGAGEDEVERKPGVRATYDFAKHGWDVKKENVVFKEALVAWVTEATYDTRTSFVAIHESEDACVEMLQKFAAGEKGAERNSL
jgi:hypothetical protein